MVIFHSYVSLPEGMIIFIRGFPLAFPIDILRVLRVARNPDIAGWGRHGAGATGSPEPGGHSELRCTWETVSHNQRVHQISNFSGKQHRDSLKFGGTYF